MNLSYSNKVYNVAVNDMPRGWVSECELNKRIYKVWHSMIERCYSGYDRYKSYEKCSVAPEWLYLSNFVKDIVKIPGYDLWLNNSKPRAVSLDKDMIRPGNTEYRLGLVQFINSQANISFKTNVSTPTGHRELESKQKSITMFKDQEASLKPLLKKHKMSFQTFMRMAVDLALEEAEKREVMKK